MLINQTRKFSLYMFLCVIAIVTSSNIQKEKAYSPSMAEKAASQKQQGATNEWAAKATISAPAVTLNSHAVQFVSNYLVKNSEPLLKAKQRSAYCFDMMDKVFTKYNLPVELKYLAVVESELNNKALSRVGAKGAWQLMPSTARILGLTVKGGYDERTHFQKSTVAAAKYLRDLYKSFDDWLLVIAAYNCGPGPVYTAIRKSGSRNFWKLQHFLPAETRGHVKKFISTHYYFEGQGSVTTLTKAERKQHEQAVAEFHKTKEQSKSQPTQNTVPTEANVTVFMLSGILIKELELS